MKHHLAGTKKDVIPYCNVQDEVKAIFLKWLDIIFMMRNDSRLEI